MDNKPKKIPANPQPIKTRFNTTKDVWSIALLYPSRRKRFHDLILEKSSV